ncbi:hypothetical protein [Nocardioides sp.]|uniref:hypothetical protein n=1 Tax=Nocardioides sp. TaxID=35761 RepID=UPI0025D04621|nr:hypothetical protein [Nocardioides sp.]
MFDPKKPFRSADAVAAGVSRRRLAGVTFRSLVRGVMISTEARVEHRQLFEAALMVHPEGAWLSHTSAAAVYGIVVPDDPNVHVSVIDAKDRRWHPGLKPHVAPPHTEVVVRDGLRVSGVVRMFIELAAVLKLVDLVVAGDSLCRVLKVRADWLRAELVKSTDYWSAAARYAAQFVRDRVDSPMETRVRMLLVLAGFAEPEVNLEIRDENGDVILRFDLAFRLAKVAVEYQGRPHVEVIANWKRDIERGDITDNLEWRVVEVISDGVYVDPQSTLDRVAAALRARGFPVPQRFDPEWIRHFPPRRRAA